ncbi:MAG TPA: outer membrane protein assembly factor BamD [Holophagaceae bacterium]|nr:outer membrane protein assembly factor BamD [Holophagaceae bacterium]
MKVVVKSVVPLLALALLVPGLGCRKAKKTPDKLGVSSAQLLTEGDALLKQGKWNEGRQKLRVLEENLPGTQEYPTAKLLLADSFFFQGNSSYPEAAVEYQSFLNYFPKHERRDYALYHLALCHYASIESAERDQANTHKAIEAFEVLLREMPGSPYVPEVRNKLVQCWRRIAEHEVLVGVFYVNTYHYSGAERRLKAALETYPDYLDRERTYYYLGEAMRRRYVTTKEVETFQKAYQDKLGRGDHPTLSPEEMKAYQKLFLEFMNSETKRFREEAKAYYQKLVESYPGTEWARRAQDRLLEMGTVVKEGLDA